MLILTFRKTAWPWWHCEFWCFIVKKETVVTRHHMVFSKFYTFDDSPDLKTSRRQKSNKAKTQRKNMMTWDESKTSSFLTLTVIVNQQQWNSIAQTVATPAIRGSIYGWFWSFHGKTIIHHQPYPLKVQTSPSPKIKTLSGTCYFIIHFVIRF